MNALAKKIIKITIYLIIMILTTSICLKAKSADSWKFIVYGDTRTNDSDHRSMLRSFTDNSPPSGQVFDHWVVSPTNTTIDDVTAASSSFTMPSSNVTVTATYRDAGSDNSLSFPLRGAFYYPWYPQTWTVGGEHVSYNVELGYYSSDDPDVVDQHIEDMDYAKIDVAIASWWGIGAQNEDARFPMLLNQTVAAGSDLKWAAYYEMEGFSDPSVDDLKSDLAYLMEKYTSHDAYARIDGKPVIFVYNVNDGSCEVADRWAEATNGEWYVNLKVFGGFRDCGSQPDSWHQYGPGSPAQQHGGYSYVIAPGFWRADQVTPLLARDVNRWSQNIRDMVASSEPWQLITTFNEWGEGTAIERCLDWASDTEYGFYLDALHYDGDVEIATSTEDSETLPDDFELAQNYPNPFNPSTTIRYDVAERTHVTIRVYDIIGKSVATLVDRVRSAGSYKTQFHASPLPSGIYILQMQAGNYHGLHKMMLIK